MPGFPGPRNRGRRWQVFRTFILERDGYRCQACGAARRLEVDHKVPCWKGGAAWDPANCQSLCRSCHIKKTRKENGHDPSPSMKAWDALVKGL